MYLFIIFFPSRARACSARVLLLNTTCPYPRKFPESCHLFLGLAEIYIQADPSGLHFRLKWARNTQAYLGRRTAAMPPTSSKKERTSSSRAAYGRPSIRLRINSK